MQRQARTLRIWALTVLVPVAVIGAALSFESLYQAARPVFGPRLALGFPLLVDFLILGASLQYVAGAKVGRPRAGWRWTAHAGVAGTLMLNALAARALRDVPWHVTAPAVWSVLVELTAREVLGQWRAIHAPLGERIPLRLWLTAPLESGRTWLRIARRVEGEQALARLDVGIHAAAVEALKLALPQPRARRVRRILRRQLRAGSLPPTAILGPLGWLDTADALTDITPETVLRAALRDTLRTTPGPASIAREQEPAVGRETLPPRPPTAEPITAQLVGEGSASTTAPSIETEPLKLQRPIGPQPQTPPMPPGQRVIDLTSAADTPPQEPGAPTVSPQTTSEPPPKVPSTVTSTGDRFADAVEIVRVQDSITASQLATQLRSLSWKLSDRTASRILTEVQDHLLRMDPWALPTP